VTENEQESRRPVPADSETPSFTRSELRAGLFVLIALIILGFFYFFGKDVGTLFLPHKRLVAQFQDISGLEVSASVKYAGMTIGEVTDIRIVEAKDHIMEVGLKVLADVPLREGTAASIRATELVIGKYIELSGGSPEAPLLEDGAIISGSQEPMIDEVLNSAGRIVLDLRDIVDRISRIFKEEDVDGFVANMKRMAEMAAEGDDSILANLQESMNAMSKGKVVENLISVTDALAQNKDRILNLVEQGNKLATDSNRILLGHEEQISSLIVELSRLAKAFSGNADTLAKNLTTLTNNTLAVSDDFPHLLENTDSLLTKLNRSVDSLNKILEKTQDIDEYDVRRFLQHEGVRIYWSEKKAPPLVEIEE